MAQYLVSTEHGIRHDHERQNPGQQIRHSADMSGHHENNPRAHRERGQKNQKNLEPGALRIPRSKHAPPLSHVACTPAPARTVYAICPPWPF